MLWELFWGILQLSGSCVNRLACGEWVSRENAALSRQWRRGMFTEGTWGLQSITHRSVLGTTAGLLSAPR